MAYDAADILMRIEGTLAGSEQFSNTWAFKDVPDAAVAQEVADVMHQLYFDIFDARSTALASAVTCEYTPLFTGGNIGLDWTTVTGGVATDLVPTECAVRFSLRSLPSGVGGGPFFPGWAVNALDADGTLDDATVAVIVTALEAMVLGLSGTTGPAQLGIHRPTTETVVEATSIRVGRVFDVIRRRRNELPEDYATVAV